MRWGIGAAGVVMGLYGAFLLWSRSDAGQQVSTVLWLAAGVVVHDVVVAALAVGIAALGTRLLPAPARPPAAVALVVLGPLTLVAVPFLGRFGAKADNPTLLDRPYVTGYLVVVALVVLAVVAASVVSRRSPTRPRR